MSQKATSLWVHARPPSLLPYPPLALPAHACPSSPTPLPFSQSPLPSPPLAGVGYTCQEEGGLEGEVPGVGYTTGRGGGQGGKEAENIKEEQGRENT